MPNRKRAITEPVVVPDDIAEAQELRAQGELDRRDAITQGFAISQLTSWLTARRELNHFGDQIQITFVPKDRWRGRGA